MSKNLQSSLSNYLLKLTQDLKDILDSITLEAKDNNLELSFLDTFTKIKSPITKQTSEIRKILADEIIYATFYTRKNTYAKSQPISNNFLSLLKEAYSSGVEGSVFREGWIAEANPGLDGSITVAKDGYYRKQALAGAYLSDEYPLKAGQPIQVRWFLTSNNNSTDQTKEVSSFYEVSGIHLPDDYVLSDDYIRFYFNLDPLAKDFNSLFPDLFKVIPSELNKRYIPFQFKALFKTEQMLRADAAVLYVSKKHFFAVIDFIEIIVANRYRSIFRDEEAMFTYKIADGIGFAEQPSFEQEDKFHFTNIPSFGMHRSAVIAYKIIDFFVQNGRLPDVKTLIRKLTYTEKNRFIPVENVFFLNRKSIHYPYVRAYFSMDNDSEPEPSPPTFATSDIKIKLLEKIGFKLCSEAIWDAYNRCSWISYNLKKGNYKTIDMSLLQGLSGVIIFFNGLYEVTQNKTFKRYYLGASKCLGIKIKDIFSFGPASFSHGYFTGSLMSLYIIKALKLEKFVRKSISSKDIIDHISPAENANTGFSDGIAGTIFILLKLYLLEPKEILYLEKAKQLGSELVKRCIINDTLTDEMYIQQSDGLKVLHLGIGTSKGLTGIALSLLYLAKISKIDYFKDAADILLNKVNSSKNKWLGWNFSMVENADGYRWSEGLNGMAFSTLSLLQADENNWKAEFMTAFDLAIRKQVTFLGNKDLIDKKNTIINLASGELIYEECLLNKNECVFDKYLEEILSALNKDIIKIKNISNDFGFKPEIQEGYAGLGYFILRLIDPNKYPSLFIPTL